MSAELLERLTVATGDYSQWNKSLGRATITHIHDQAQRIEKLEEALAEAHELFRDSQSGYIPGCGSDQQWTARRDALMETIEALHPTETGEVNDE